MSWNDGYVVEVDYTHGYYGEISPSALRLATLSAAVRTQPGRPLRYLELGFGQGLSLNIHAAACEGEFWGTDFNPAHAADARDLAAASGSGARIFDQSFEAFAERDDLPEFDIIALHGVWSWISPRSRAVIVDLARRKLAVGGLLYVSYNCMAGWGPAMPLRHLLSTHAALDGDGGGKGLTDRIEAALGFAQQVADAGAGYFTANPAAVERLQAIKGLNRHYVAHEYFTKDAHPMPFSQFYEEVSVAKVDFACSSNMLNQLDALGFPPAIQAVMAPLKNPILRETTIDCIKNTTFRKDILVKGRRGMTSQEQVERYLDLEFVLLLPPDAIKMTVAGPFGDIALQEDIYRPLVEMLAEDGGAPKTGRFLLEHPKWPNRPGVQLMEALSIMAGAAYIHTAQDARTVEAVALRCRALNRSLCDRARFADTVSTLASPVTGGGVTVDRIEQLFLASLWRGGTTPEAWAKDAWAALSTMGQGLARSGKALDKPEDNLKELQSLAAGFRDKRLAMLTALGVA